MRHLSTINEIYKKTLLSASKKAKVYNQPEKAKRFMDHAWKRGRVHNIDRISSFVFNTDELDFGQKGTTFIKVDGKDQKWYIVNFKFEGDYVYGWSGDEYGIKFSIQIVSEFGITGDVEVECHENGYCSLKFSTNSDEANFTFKDRKKAIEFKKMLEVDGIDELSTYIKDNHIQANTNNVKSYPEEIFDYFFSKYSLSDKQEELLSIAAGEECAYLGIIYDIRINRIYSERAVIKDPGALDMSKSSTTTKSPINYKFKS